MNQPAMAERSLHAPDARDHDLHARPSRVKEERSRNRVKEESRSHSRRGTMGDCGRDTAREDAAACDLAIQLPAHLVDV